MHANTLISQLSNETLELYPGVPPPCHTDRHYRKLTFRLPFLRRNLYLCLRSDQIGEYLNRTQPLSIAIAFEVVDEYLEESDNKYSRENPEAFTAPLMLTLQYRFIIIWSLSPPFDVLRSICEKYNLLHCKTTISVDYFCR